MYILADDPVLVAATSNSAGAQLESKNSNHVGINSTPNMKVSPCRKRKISSWQRGHVNNRKKRRKDRPVLSENAVEDQVGVL